MAVGHRAGIDERCREAISHHQGTFATHGEHFSGWQRILSDDYELERLAVFARKLNGLGELEFRHDRYQSNRDGHLDKSTIPFHAGAFFPFSRTIGSKVNWI